MDHHGRNHTEYFQLLKSLTLSPEKSTHKDILPGYYFIRK